MNSTVKKESLNFMIEGEWLTEFARTWFWDENRSYDECEKLLFSCMPQPDSNEMLSQMKKTVLDILEGRKKLVGVNDFQLVDDNKNIRYISDKLKQEEYKCAIDEIIIDIFNNGIKYIDKYSTVKSIKEARARNVTTAEECSY